MAPGGEGEEAAMGLWLEVLVLVLVLGKLLEPKKKLGYVG